MTTTNATLTLEQISQLLENASQNGSDSGARGELTVFLPVSLVHCTRERPVLCLLLMLATLWLGYALYLVKRR